MFARGISLRLKSNTLAIFTKTFGRADSADAAETARVPGRNRYGK